MELENAVVIVTGASSGIGEATARAFAKRGAKVALAARREERLAAIQKEITEAGGTALSVVTDVTKRESVEALVKKTEAELGPVDVLVNNAGIMPLSFLENLHLDEWERMVDVNVKGVLFGVGAVLPSMMERKRGHVVNVSSVAGRRLFPSGAVYCATKFAVTALSEGMRSELSKKYGIRTTAIEPGAVATELPNTITDEAVRRKSSAFDDMRMLESEDIAKAVLYAVEQPDHVDVSEILVMPSDQAS